MKSQLAALLLDAWEDFHGLARMATLTYFHLGEVAGVRAALGHQVGDYPGHLGRLL